MKRYMAKNGMLGLTALCIVLAVCSFLFGDHEKVPSVLRFITGGACGACLAMASGIHTENGYRTEASKIWVILSALSLCAYFGLTLIYG